MNELLRIRKALDLTQVEFADRLGLHQSTVSRFENGDLPIDKRTLLAAKAIEHAGRTPTQAAAA